MMATAAASGCSTFSSAVEEVGRPDRSAMLLSDGGGVDTADPGLVGRARLAPVCTVGHFFAGFFSGARATAAPAGIEGSSSALPDNTNCPFLTDAVVVVVSAILISQTGLVFPFERPAFDSSDLDDVISD